MRLLLIVAGAIAAIVFIERPAERTGVLITIWAAVPRIVGSRRITNAWQPCAGLAGPVRQVRITTIDASGLAYQLRQLGDVRRDPPRLVFREQLGRIAVEAGWITVRSRHPLRARTASARCRAICRA